MDIFGALARNDTGPVGNLRPRKKIRGRWQGGPGFRMLGRSGLFYLRCNEVLGATEEIKEGRARDDRASSGLRQIQGSGKCAGVTAQEQFRVNLHEQDLHDLIGRSLQGDNAAYRQFLNRLGAQFRAFFRRNLPAGGAAQIEDLVQETLLAVHLHRQSYDPSRRITAWVYAIARYKLIDHYRRSPSSRIFVPVDAIDDLFSQDTPDASDPAHDIETLLGRLPPKQRMAIRLVKLDELSAKDAAERMGISEADVKISVHRGLKKLMAFVGKEIQA